MNLQGSSVSLIPMHWQNAIHELKVDLGLRLDLKDFNLTDEQVAELVKTSHHPNMLNNPVEITDEILNEMYQSMR